MRISKGNTDLSLAASLMRCCWNRSTAFSSSVSVSSSSATRQVTHVIAMHVHTWKRCGLQKAGSRAGTA